MLGDRDFTPSSLIIARELLSLQPSSGSNSKVYVASQKVYMHQQANAMQQVELSAQS